MWDEEDDQDDPWYSWYRDNDKMVATWNRDTCEVVWYDEDENPI
jgi:hypothetical protein